MPSSSPSSDAVTAYARRIVDGELPSGKWHRLACERHLRDLRESEAGSRWIFRPELAEKAFGIFALCRHFKGEWAGEPIRLEPWQQFIVGSLMGWVDRETGLRRFRNAFIELPRGNGKSTLAGGLLLLFAFFLGEGGAEAYSVATKKDQARISFQAARQMLLRSSALRKHVEISKYNVHSLATESKMEALGADADTLDGLRPFFVCVDEVHKLPSTDLVDVMESGMGTRRDPMLFEITTAGSDDHSVYGQHHLLSTRVLDRTVPLDEWFSFIAAADPEDDWTIEATWRKANPNYGISVKPDYLEKEVRKALANPAEQAKVRRLYLGQKVQAVDGCFSVLDWKACPPLPPDDELRRYECWLGIDLSSSVDITAAVLIWKLAEDEWALKPFFWAPEDTLESRGQEDRAPYVRWASENWLRTTNGRTIDRDQFRREVRTIAQEWKVRGICADPWQMHVIGSQWADDDKLPVVLVPQRYEMLSVPNKLMQARILDRRIRHDHNPLMTLMVSNSTWSQDERGNVQLSKRRSRGRIDGPQALVNAISQMPTQAAPVLQMFFLGGKK